MLIPILLSCCLVGFAQVPPAAVQPGKSTAAPSTVTQARGVERYRALKANFRLFSASSASKFLNRLRQDSNASLATEFALFSNLSLRIRWTAVAPTADEQGWSWTGKIAGYRNSSAVLLASGTIWTANFSTGDGRMYQLRSLGSPEEPVLWVLQINQSSFDSLDRPVPNPKP